MGAGWNLRRVYKLASGKYFKWAAADDLLEPEFLGRCVDALERDAGCVVAYANIKEIDENGAFILELRHTDEGMIRSHDFREMILGIVPSCLCVTT